MVMASCVDTHPSLVWCMYITKFSFWKWKFW